MFIGTLMYCIINLLKRVTVTILGIANSGKNNIFTFGFDLSALCVSGGDQPQSSKAFQEAASNSMANIGFVPGTTRGPISKGYLELQSTNVSVYYYRHHEFHVVVEILFQKHDDTVSFEDLRPKNPNATTFLEQYCIGTVMTVWHYHGGC
ncbi:hypothetical protein V6N13_140640 [Hibiscus sabdariffa]|uniref:Uncharacterized protein n=2 Tax=Hibiscus sabdariffa TaxID=183260 RepID=A0ABR2Q2A9_9ROSI